MKSRIKFNHKIIKAGKETKVYLLVKVTGTKGDTNRERLPLNLSVVIDRSGSMSGDKLKYVKLAAKELVSKLGPKDRLSLVAYDDTIQHLLPPKSVSDKQPFYDAISPLKTGGMTNLSGGWLQGCDYVGSELEVKGVNRVLLLTDGLANRGISDSGRLAVMAGQKKEQGISTTTFGVGMDYNEDLLSRMASEGGGAFYFIDNPDQAAGLFAEELTDLYNVVGQNLQVAIDTETKVRSVKQLYEYPRGEERGALVYQLGDLYAEEDRYQLFELHLRELNEGEIHLGQVTISYDRIQGEGIKKVERTHEIVIQAVTAEEYRKRRPDKEVQKMVLIQEARMARAKALELADQREFSKAQAILEEMAESIKASRTRDEELLDLRDQLLEEARDMEFGAQRYDTYSRKSQMSKISNVDRFSRSFEMQDDLHLRKVMSAASIERRGPAPLQISWRGGRLKLNVPEVRIGSAPDNDIVLENYAEEYHCRLIRRGRDWYLEDSSQGGTIANAGLVNGPFRLSRGDIIRIGKVMLELE